MRDIKLRAWDISRQEMLKGYELHDRLTFGWGTNPPSELAIHSGKPYIHLMQYTGLKDKDGVEIYEGDILSYPYTSRKYDANSVAVKLMKKVTVEYDTTDRCGFKPFCDDWDYDGMSFTDTYSSFSVIGNIYENPELING